MKKDLGAQGQLFPQEVFVVASYDEDGVPNAMNVAWGAQVTMSELAINVSSHKSTDNILARRAFTISPADAAHVVEADYFGMATGRKANKAEKSGLTFVRSEHVDAPVIEEFPVALECEVVDVQDLGGEWRIVGRIVNARVDEDVLDDQGRVDFDRVHPIVYDATRRIYRVVGEEVGQAWSSGKALL